MFAILKRVSDKIASSSFDDILAFLNNQHVWVNKQSFDRRKLVWIRILI